MFQPSKYQQDIFDFVENSPHSAIISAVAGSGKTTTIVEAVKRLPGQDYIFLAFNKSIAEELKSRGVKASTFHALCFAELNSRLAKRPKVDSGKLRDLFRAICPDEEREEYFEVPKLVSLAKNAAFTCGEGNDDWQVLIDDHMLSFPDDDHAIKLADRLLCISNTRLDVIDFDDMLYIPWLKGFALRTYATVFIDEAQDTNKLQLLLLQRLVDPFAGRLIAVGDQAQAIYGFRGAGTGSMENMREMFKCNELPLSVSYRCSRAVVMEAKNYVPHIESFSAATEGSVARVESWRLDHLTGGAVICRLNRPLVKLAFQLIAAGKSIRYLGKDISAQLKHILKRAADGKANLDTIIARVEAERDIEVNKAEANGRGRVAYIEDKYGSLLSILEQLPSHAGFREVNEAIDRIFRETPGASITLCTVHKAKGLEWPNVFILDADKYMPHPRSTEGWQLQQEYNMLYVAITRSKDMLFYIRSEDLQ